MNKMNLNKLGTGLFFTLLSFYLLYTGAFTYLFSGPDAIHFIRQIDSLNFIRYYKDNGMDFFNTGSYSLDSIDGKGVCEFPLHYYLIAWIETLFGEHILFLKYWNFILSTTAIFLFYKIVRSYISFTPIPIFLSLVLYSSTILQYYQNNYLPDSSAWSFSFIGLYFALKYLKQEKNKWAILAFVFLTWASLLKPTFLLVSFSISAAFFFSSPEPIFQKFKKHKVWFLLQCVNIALTLAWVYYMKWYNAVYNNYYFLTHITPYWQLSIEDRASVWNMIQHYWYAHYYPKPFHWIGAFLMVFGWISYKKSDKFIYYISVFSFLGSAAYFILFFKQFRDHDYYFILISFSIFISILNAFIVIYNHLKNEKMKWALAALLCIGLIHGALRVESQLDGRYHLKDHVYFTRVYTSILASKSDIQKAIPMNKRVVVYPDNSVNGSLYALERYGWTIPNAEESYVKERLDLLGFYEGDQIWILITNPESVEQNYLAEFLGEKKGEFGDLQLFTFSEKYQLEAANQRRLRNEPQ